MYNWADWGWYESGWVEGTYEDLEEVPPRHGAMPIKDLERVDYLESNNQLMVMIMTFMESELWDQ